MSELGPHYRVIGLLDVISFRSPDWFETRVLPFALLLIFLLGVAAVFS